MSKETTTKTIDGIRYVKRWVVVYLERSTGEWLRWDRSIYTKQANAEWGLAFERDAHPDHEFLLSPLFVPESLPVPEKKP